MTTSSSSHAVPRPAGRRQFLRNSAVASAVLALGNGRAAAARATIAPRLRAGAAELVATPDAVGSFLIGPLKPSTGIHDELFLRALVLDDDGGMPAAIVTLDYLGFDLAYTEKLIAAASEGAGVPPGNVLLNCSHTHSAPLSVPWGPWREHRNASFFNHLPIRIREVTRLARERLQPATLRSHQAPVQIGFNRRLLHGDRITMATNPAGVVVPWTDVLAIDGTDGQPIAVVFAYAAHPVIIHATSTLISAEYPGFAIERLKELPGPKPVFLFAQGFAGNINGFPLRGGIDAARAAGRELGDAVLRALELPPRARFTGKLAVRSMDLELPLQTPPTPAAVETMIATEKSNERRGHLERLLGVARRGRAAPMPCPIRALALGHEICVVGVAHEPFAEYHHRLLAASPYAHTFGLGYTNGMQAYLPTAKDLRLGDRAGYEASTRGAAFTYESSLPVVPESEAMIHAGFDRLLKDR